MGFRRDRRDEKERQKQEDYGATVSSEKGGSDRKFSTATPPAMAAPSADATILVQDFSQKIQKLHMEYQKYFSGAEKKAPQNLRTLVNQDAKRLHQLLRETMGKGAAPLKIRSALTSYETYCALWDKQLGKQEKA